jgi:hypothetical protein
MQLYVTHPKTRRKIFLDNSISNYEERLDLVNKKVLTKEIVEYCQNNAYLKNNTQTTSYKNAEQLLENCATYLLLGQYEKNNIMTIYNIRQAQIKEIPASLSDNNAEDLMYSVNSSEENIEKHLTSSTEILYNTYMVDKQQLTVGELERQDKKIKKQTQRYKQTKSCKLRGLESTPIVRTYRMVQQFNIDDSGKKKPMKNVFGQAIFDVEYMNIGGRVGLIDESNAYQSKWCTVDTENRFRFEGFIYEINNCLLQYQPDENQYYKMEKILVIPRNERLYFFDENIDEISEADVSVAQVA